MTCPGELQDVSFIEDPDSYRDYCLANHPQKAKVASTSGTASAEGQSLRSNLKESRRARLRDDPDIDLVSAGWLSSGSRIKTLSTGICSAVAF